MLRQKKRLDEQAFGRHRKNSTTLVSFESIGNPVVSKKMREDGKMVSRALKQQHSEWSITTAVNAKLEEMFPLEVKWCATKLTNKEIGALEKVSESAEHHKWEMMQWTRAPCVEKHHCALQLNLTEWMVFHSDDACNKTTPRNNWFSSLVQLTRIILSHKKWAWEEQSPMHGLFPRSVWAPNNVPGFFFSVIAKLLFMVAVKRVRTKDAWSRWVGVQNDLMTTI